jgi:soluble lytic murein transglycosylase
VIEWIQRHRGWLFVIILLGGLAKVGQRWWARRERSQDAHILAAARKYRVDPALVKAVVWRESRFNARAAGAAGEIGLMQIREPAAQEWAEAERVRSFHHRQLFDPAQNTQAGTWYLRKHLRRFGHTDHPVPYALAAYNAGASNVARWSKGDAATNSAAFLAQIDFPGTRDYVQAVMKRQQRYRRDFKSDAALAQPPRKQAAQKRGNRRVTHAGYPNGVE